jgi:DNA-binding MarR family transcriptional regulator
MDKMTMMKGVRFIEEFRKFDPEMQLQTAATFMWTVIQPGITMKEMMNRLGISQASCSRNAAALSARHRKDRPGHDLIEIKPDPEDHRRKVLYPTPKGNRVAETIWEILDAEVPNRKAPESVE